MSEKLDKKMDKNSNCMGYGLEKDMAILSSPETICLPTCPIAVNFKGEIKTWPK